MTEQVSDLDEKRVRNRSVFLIVFKIIVAALKLSFSFCLFSIFGVGLGRLICSWFGLDDATVASARYWGWIFGGGIGLIVPCIASGGSLAMRKNRSGQWCGIGLRQSEQPHDGPVVGAIVPAAEKPVQSVENPDATGANAKTVIGHALVFGLIGLLAGALVGGYGFVVWSSVALGPWAPKDWGSAVQAWGPYWSTSHSAAFIVFLGPMAVLAGIGLIGGAIWGSTKWHFR